MKTLNFILVGLIFLCILSCKNSQFTAAWLDHDIKIDGDPSDWEGHLTAFEKQNIAAGFMHDSTYFSMCFVSNSEDINRQIAMRGFYLKLAASPGGNGVFELKYPLGMRESGGPLPQEKPNPGEMPQNMTFLWNQLEMKKAYDKDFKRIMLRELSPDEGEVKANIKPGQLVYEVKIPIQFLTKDLYTPGEGTAETIKIALETSQGDLRNFGPPMSGNEDGGGMRGGRMGGRGGGENMGDEGSMPDRSRSFGIKFEVKLKQE